MHVRLLAVEVSETLVGQRRGDTGLGADEVVTEVRFRSYCGIPASKVIRCQVSCGLALLRLVLRVHSNVIHSVMYVFFLYARYYAFVVPTSCCLRLQDNVRPRSLASREAVDLKSFLRMTPW